MSCCRRCGQALDDPENCFRCRDCEAIRQVHEGGGTCDECGIIRTFYYVCSDCELTVELSGPMKWMPQGYTHFTDIPEEADFWRFFGEHHETCGGYMMPRRFE